MSPLMLAVLQVVLLVAVVLLLIFRSRGSTGELLPRLAELRILSERMDQSVREEMRALRSELTSSNQQARADASAESRALREELLSTVNSFGTQLSKGLSDSRQEQGQAAGQFRDSVSAQVERLTSSLTTATEGLIEKLQRQFTELTSSNDQKLESLRQTVESRLDKLNQDNSKKLDEMRQTVDEKLHSTLEKRLTDSFGLVTDQLGSVQRGLGEMKELATGVGDLKRLLTNIKSRGGYGEVQLAMLLDQILSPEQFVKNAHIGDFVVEFAIKLPGQASEEPVLLPVDAKFPREAWDRLEDAKERGDLDGVKKAGEELAGAVYAAAKDINQKYISPPLTTPFGVMFLATEGLYAEVVRRPGLTDELQTKYRVTVAGPTTFAALLTSFQMGFRTLAIQKKGNEVWKVLAATKAEFEKFGGLMERVEKNIGTVQNTLHDVGTRTRAITRTLRSVETTALQPGEATALLGLNNLKEAEADATGSATAASEPAS